MVTCVQPLTVWMYRDCYLRFSSRKFNLNDFHEAIHLTNNAIQYKYQVATERDKALPSDNMWDNHTFKVRCFKYTGEVNLIVLLCNN